MAYSTGERREKLVSKNVIYEVELVQFIPREDINHNGSVFKQTLSPSKQIDTPGDLDEVSVHVTAFQHRGDVFAPFEGSVQFEQHY